MKTKYAAALAVALILVFPANLKTFAAASHGGKANVIVADAKKRGVKKCLDRIEKVTDQVLGEAVVGAYVVADEHHPDSGIYTAMISRHNKGGGTQMVSLSVSPDEKCTATVDITSVWNAACRRIGPKWFSGYKPKVRLPGNVIVRVATRKKQVYMVPLPGGCMTIQKETYN